jgi:hypothetical protein
VVIGVSILHSYTCGGIDFPSQGCVDSKGDASPSPVKLVGAYRQNQADREVVRS